MSNNPRAVTDADLHAFTDQCAETDRRGRVLTYLETDAAEYRRVSDWCGQNDAIRRVLGKAVVESFPASTCRIGAAAAVIPTSIRTITRTRGDSVLPPRDESPPPAPLWVSALRLVTALVFGFGLGWAGARMGHAPVGSARSAAASADAFLPPASANDLKIDFAANVLDAHQTFATDALHPVEVSAREEPRLLQWVTNRVGEGAAVPDLAGAGYAFLGGRLIPSSTGPAAMFVYENIAGERLGFSMGRTDAPLDQTLLYHDAHGFGAVAWGDASRLFAISGVADNGKLAAVAGRVITQFAAQKGH